MKKDHPGIYIPPPLLYVAFFLFSLILQRCWPLYNIWLANKTTAIVSGCLCILIGIGLAAPAISRFIVSKNTLVTALPARSLQTTGVYRYTRNPMYMGLLFIYLGIAFFKGNTWTFIVFPILVVIVQVYLIRKEEHYLQRRFGEEFNIYKKQVRRWI